MEKMSRQFLASGGIHPRGWPQGNSRAHAECLIEGHNPSVEVTVRLLQKVERRVIDADGAPVESLTVAGRRYAGGEETSERELRLAGLPDRTAAVRAAGRKEAELIEGGRPAGTLSWSWEPLHCTVEAWVDELAPGLRRVRVEVANRLEWDGGPPGRAPMRTLHSTHLLLHSPDGAFVSVAEPPPRLREQALACRNEGLWPVPLGEAGDRRTMLAAPVRLDDYPDIDPRGLASPIGARPLSPARHAA